MAFVLSAKLNLLPPSNVAIIAGQIRRQLNNVSVGVSLIAPTNTKSIVTQINNDLKKINKNVKINVNAKTLATGTSHIKQAALATNKLSTGVEGLGYQAARSIKHYAAFALTTSSVIKLAAAFGAGIGDAIKYDRELVRVSQVTGQSTDSLKGLSKEVTRLSVGFGVSSEKILESAVTLSQAGLSAKDTKVALEALAKTGLSATFGDIKNTTEAAIAIMQQFGLEAKDLEGILGSVNAVSAAFAVESDDIAVAVRRSGGALKAAGVNFHEFSALLTSVRQTTRESAESIATGFRTIFARLQRTRTQDFLKNLGIDVLNDDGLFVGGYEAIRRISTALEDISTVDPRFSQIVEELGGFRQVSKVIPLIEQFEVAEKALSVSLRGGTSLTKDAAVAQESLEVQFTKTREAFLALIRDIVTDQGFKQLIKFTLSLADAFIKVADSIRPIIPLITLMGGASFINKFGPLKGGFKKGILGLNSGGGVPGNGDGDTVPAMLTPGEFVINKRAAKQIGISTLTRLNKSHSVKKFAKGGLVGNLSKIANNPASAIGVIGVIGSVANSFSNAEGALSSFTQEILNVASKFAILSTVFQVGQKAISDNIRLGKYTKAGREIAARNEGNVDITDITRHDPRTKEFARKSLKGKSLQMEKERDLSARQAFNDFQEEANQRGRAKAKELSEEYKTQNPGKKIPKNVGLNIKAEADKARQDYLATNMGNIQNRKTRQEEIAEARAKAVTRANRRYRREYRAYQINNNGIAPNAQVKEEIRARARASGQRYLDRSINDIQTRRANNLTDIQTDIANGPDYKNRVTGFATSLGKTDEFKNVRQNRVNALNKQTRLKAEKFNNKVAIGAAVGGAVGGIAGDLFSRAGANEIAAGGQSTIKSSVGGALSSAATYGATGAAIGSVIPVIGTAVGAIAGALIGGAKGYVEASAEASKQIRAIRLDKDLEKFGRKLNELASGNSSVSDISGQITSSISSAFSDISKLQGVEKSDAIAKFKNNASAVESFYKDIAKNSSSLDEFNKATNNTLIEFSAISGIGFGELISGIDNTIKAEIKAKAALDSLTAATAATEDTQSILQAFSTAVTLASTSLEGFDRNLDRIEANSNFTGANRKSIDAGGIFKAAAGGKFSDYNQVANTSTNLLSSFGSVGSKIAQQTGDAAKARQLIPGIVKEFAAGNFEGLKTPGDLAQQRLGEARVSQNVIDQVLVGITNAIGNESDQTNLEKKFAADPQGTSNNITKVLTDIIEEMEIFANKTSEHNTKVGRLFDLSSQIQTKINDMRIQQADKEFALRHKIDEDRGNPISIGSAENLDSMRAASIAGLGGRSVNTTSLFNRASEAKSKIKGLDEIIANKELNGQNAQEEIKARREQIDILIKSTDALKKMTEDGYEFAAVERELAKAGNERRFRRDALTSQAFGSRESKLNEAKTIAAVIALDKDKINVSQLNDDAKDSVFKFLEQNFDTKFAGLGNKTGGDVLKQELIQDQALKLQKYGGLSPEAALAKAQDNVKQGFEGTKTEEALRTKLLDVVTAQGVASQALQDLLKQDDPLHTNLLASENTRFLGELGKILTDKLVNQEQVKIDRANEILQKGVDTDRLPKVEDIQNALAVSQINDDVRRTIETQEKTKKGNLEAIAKTKNLLTDDKYTYVQNSGSRPRETINSEGRTILRNFAKDTLNLTPEQTERVLNSDERIGGSKPSEIMDRLLKEYQSQSGAIFGKEQNAIIGTRRDSIREVNPLLQGKTSAELQDLLEKKKNAPTEAARRAAQQQIDTSNNSIMQLNSDTVTRMDSSVKNLNMFATNFQNSIDKMNGMEMSLNGSHKVEVVFNGAEVLTQLMPNIEQLMINKTNEAINKMLKDKFPNAGLVNV